MTRSQGIRIASLALLLAVTAPVLAEAGEGVPDTIRYYETVAMISPAGAADAAVGTVGANTLELSFSTLGREFDLKLEAHDPFAPGASVHWVDDTGVVEEPADRGMYFRGRVEGDPDSWVRLTLRGGALAGVVTTSDEMYFLEPAARFFGAGAASETLAYRLSDVDTSALETSCGARQLDSFQRPRKGPRMILRDTLEAAGGVAAATSLKRAQIGLIADYEYFNKPIHGASSAADMLEILNNVDGIYQSELGVTVQAGPTVVFTTSDDPFTAATMLDLLDQVGHWKDANDDSAGQLMWGSDLAHLFTGRDLSGSVIGIAYIGSLCDSFAGVGVDEDFTPTASLLTLLLAHEMGHNFGAPHDNEQNSACGSEPGIYIMNPSISPSLQQKFSPCSKSQIAPKVTAAGCLDNVVAGTPTATPTPAPAALAALFVSQSVPASMSAGQQYSVSVSMRNTGTTTWTAAQGIRLGAVNPYDNYTWGMNRVLLAGGDSIAPGQEKVFTWNVTAPTTAGTYNFQWRMVRDGVAWFGDLSTNLAVAVSVPPTPTKTPTPVGIPPLANAVFVNQSVPAAMTAGQQYSVSVTMTNTGGTTWTAGAMYRLGAINPYDNTVWGANRIAMGAGESIAPNQQKTFTWTVTAPAAAGSYNFQWRMVQDGVTWFGGNSTNVVVAVSSAPNAALVSSSVPTTMVAGQLYSVSVTMRNTGSTTWTPGALYRLGAINPYDNFTWSMNRVALAAGDSIAPNQAKTFTWTVRAPSAGGTYNFQWRMVQDGVTWFGANGANTVISVQ